VEGKNTRLEFDLRIHLASRIAGQRGSVYVAGAHRAGLTIYREGARIPMEYRLLDGDGKTLTTGPMEYG